jgi:hypothetical protein
MSIAYCFQPQERAVFIRITGRMPTRVVTAAMRTIEADPAIPQGPRVLVDLSRSELARTQEEADRIVQTYSELGKLEGARVALVAGREVVYGVTRMISMIADYAGFDVQAFRSLEAAAAWLELSRLPDEELWSTRAILLVPDGE